MLVNVPRPPDGLVDVGVVEADVEAKHGGWIVDGAAVETRGAPTGEKNFIYLKNMLPRKFKQISDIIIKTLNSKYNLEYSMHTQWPAVSTYLLLITAPPQVSKSPSPPSGPSPWPPGSADRMSTIQGRGREVQPFTIRTYLGEQLGIFFQGHNPCQVREK